MVLDRLPENFLLMNGDILTDLDYGDLLDSHVSSGRADRRHLQACPPGRLRCSTSSTAG